MLGAKERPVRPPDATVDGEGVDQRRGIRIDVAIGKALAGIAKNAREFDDRPLPSEFEQRLKAGLAQSLLGIWAAAMIDDDRKAGTLQRQHGVENGIALVVDRGKPALLARETQAVLGAGIEQRRAFGKIEVEAK